jgi:hypothetical protein
MIIREFTYEKEDGSLKAYTVALVRERNGSFEGISMGEWSKEEQDKIKSIYQKFEAELAPYYKKGWRKFLNVKIREMTESKENLI